MVDQTRSWRQRGDAAFWLDAEVDRADWEADADNEASNQPAVTS
jgi:hypothetical protein